MADLSEQAAFAMLEERLTSKYADLPRDQITSVVHNAHARFEQSRIRDFVPLLVERRAGVELSKVARRS